MKTQSLLDFDYVTYEDFGRRFFELAVTEERVAAAFAEIAGDEFEMGPMAQGPAGLARVTAKVKIQQPHVRRTLGDTITFAIRIPLIIELVIDLWLDKQRFVIDGDIALLATARAAQPLLIVIDVAKTRPSDIAVHVTSRSVRGEILRILAGVDGEIKRFVAAYVAEEIDSPASQQAKIIDVAEQTVSAWDAG